MAVMDDRTRAVDSLAEDSSITRTGEFNDEDMNGTQVLDGSKEIDQANDNRIDEDAVEPEQPPRDITGWKWYLTLVSMLNATFLYALDATVVADIQVVIVEEFGRVQDIAWLSVAFLLCATATNLVWGRIYGHFNAKWLYIFHVAVFEIGSAICGAAPSMNVMILGRAIAGVGGSGTYVGCMTLIVATTTMAERPLYISCTGFTWGLGIVLGPVIGGAFSQSSVGWRWAFYINLFMGAVCAPFYLFLLPSKDPRPGTSLRQRATELDYLGIVPWDSGRITALFVVTGVLWILLGIQQVWNIFTTQSRRIIPVQFFKSRTILTLFSATAASGSCAFVPIYMVPLFFQFTRNDSPLDAGVRLLPIIVVMVVIVFANGHLMSKLGYYMPWYLVGGILVVVGGALMYTVKDDTSTSRVYGYTVLMGAGVGMFLQASFSVAQAVVDPENIAPAIGFITLAQFIGITMALAIANTIVLNTGQTKIQQILPNVSTAEIQAALLGSRSGLVQNLSPDLKARVLEAIVDAIDKTYILVIAGGALVAVLSLTMRREKLFGASPGVAAV